MGDDNDISILPYTRIVGQNQLKLALELSYIEPRISGVLVSGERGTGKSTIVRAFSKMVYGHLPVTIPINATEDRVMGGWQIDELLQGKAKEEVGLLVEADKKLLYIDEVNLLDDHIVNVILDVTSTGVLIVQRESLNKEPVNVQFMLVGTMNPEEGNLRPQFLDRFGLLVRVTTDTDPIIRYKILRAVLDFDDALFQRSCGITSTYWEDTGREVGWWRMKIEAAKAKVHSIEVPDQIAICCALLADEFHTEGHRSEHLLVLASRACAAHDGQDCIARKHIEKVAPFVLQHRQNAARQLNRVLWSEDDDKHLQAVLARALSVTHHD